MEVSTKWGNPNGSLISWYFMDNAIYLTGFFWGCPYDSGNVHLHTDEESLRAHKKLTSLGCIIGVPVVHDISCIRLSVHISYRDSTHNSECGFTACWKKPRSPNGGSKQHLTWSVSTKVPTVCLWGVLWLYSWDYIWLYIYIDCIVSIYGYLYYYYYYHYYYYSLYRI